MAYSNGIITAPVSIRDVQRALGISSGDVGTLCRSSMINMWAKFKPIYHAAIGLLKNSQRQDGSHIVSGYSISWGIMKPNAMSWSDYIDTHTGIVKSGKWLYDRPAGGSASPYRLADFVEINDNGEVTTLGYYHAAVCPITFHFSEEENLIVPYQSTYNGTTISFLFTFQNGVLNWAQNYCLSLSEIFSSELDFYPTVIMTCKQGGRIWEYAKSGDNKIRYYTGNVNPFVQVLVDTKDICDSVAADGGSYHSGPLANGQVWTCCMVLTSLKVAGTAASHTVNSGSIRMLEYEDGADRRELTIVNTTPMNDVTGLSYTVTITKSGSSYYISSIAVTITTTTGDVLNFTIDASFVSLIGTIGGTGWSGNQQQESKTNWTSMTINSNERGQTVTKQLSADMPRFDFTGDVYQGQRIAGGTLTFRVGAAYLSGSFSINVAGGASSYSQTVVIK